MKESRKRFYALSNRTQDGIYSFNLSIKKYVYTNPAFIRIFGHPCKDIATTDSVMERIVRTDRKKLSARIGASIAEGKDGGEMEYRCTDVDGNMHWMHDRWVVLRDDAGSPLALEGIVRDVTEMKNIASMKDYLERVLESCMDAIVVTDQSGWVTLANKGAEALLRADGENLVGKFIGDVVRTKPDENRDMYRIILDRAPTTNFEIEADLLDGSTVPLLISSALLSDAEGRMAGTISYIRDISVRKQAEEQIRLLSQKLIRTKEVEMSGIARDLHDHLAQNLYALNIQLSTFIKRLPLPDARCESQSQKLLDSLQSIMGDVRKMVFNIHPPSLHTLGVARTVNNLCENITQIHGLPIDFKTAGMDALQTNFDVNIAIYRLIQEGLTNIVKHAEASAATIRLVYSYPKIIIRIEDNGRGFTAARVEKTAAEGSCMGVWSMKERVALLNGKMTTNAAPGQGTSIVVEINYPIE